MPRYELSLTKTEYLVTTLDAASPEEARELCKQEHSPADVEIHSVNEVARSEKRLTCSGCRFDGDEKKFAFCGHPENTGPDAAFWDGDLDDCFEEAPKIVSEGDTVFETGTCCVSCGGDEVTNGEHVWCSKCSQLVHPETI